MWWPCLLLVLESEDIKRQILASSLRLRHCDSWKSVFTTSDLACQENEVRK